MGRIFQTSTPRRCKKSPATLLPVKLKAKYGDKLNSKASYQSFYNVQKTRISARYPFLPSNQIERRIKQLWENSSAEKRAAFCSSLPGTTPVKSPFRGTILKGLLKRASCSGFQDHHRPETNVPVLTSPPSVRLPDKATHGILRSSEKKRASNPRVSFRLDTDSMPSPIPVCNQAKRSLAGRYFSHSGAETGTNTTPSISADYSSVKEPGKKEAELKGTGYGQNGTACDNNGSSSLQILPAGDGQTMDDVSSTADVNIVKPGFAKEGGNTSNEQADNCQKFFSDNTNECPAEKASSTPTRQTPSKKVNNTPTRQSRRAAAIVAKAKIRSPQIVKQIETKHNEIKRKQPDVNQKSPSITIIHRLKKTELSWEEKQMYEFQDDDKPSDRGSDVLPNGRKVITRTRLQTPQAPAERNPEEYNLDSNVNKLVFGQDSQSPSQTHPLECLDAVVAKSSEKKRQRRSGSGTTSAKKRGRPRKVDKTIEDSTQDEEPAKKRRGRPRKRPAQTKVQNEQLTAFKHIGSTEVTLNEKNEQSSQQKDGIQGSYDFHIAKNDEEHVPWMVSAHPSSSDEADDVDDDEDSDAALYQHYQMDSDESSTPHLSTQESLGVVSSSQKVCEGFEAFCSSVLSSHDKMASPEVPIVESPLMMSPASSDSLPLSLPEDTPEVPLVQDDVALLPRSIPNRMSALADSGIMLADGPRPSPLSRKQKMRLQNGDVSESSQSSDAEECNEVAREARNEGKHGKVDQRNAQRKRKEDAGTPSQRVSLTNSPLYAGDKKKPEKGWRNARTKETSPAIITQRQETDGKMKSRPQLLNKGGNKREEVVEDSSENIADGRRGSQIFVGWDHPSRLPDSEDDSLKHTSTTTRLVYGERPKKPRRSFLSELNCDVNVAEPTAELSHDSKKTKSLEGRDLPNLFKQSDKPLLHSKMLSRSCSEKAKRSKRFVVNADMRDTEPLSGKDELGKGEMDKAKEGLMEQENDENSYPDGDNPSNEEAESTGDGILCELFPPCKPQRRLHSPNSQQSSPPNDPVSTHLFLEENFFF